MGENSKIQWTDATFNGWIGCTKVAPECDECYALDEANRRGWAQWGPGRPRMLTSEAYWRQPFAWNLQAGQSGLRPKVFAFSLADVFDVEAPAWPKDRPILHFPLRRGKGVRWSTVVPDRASARDVFLRDVVQVTPNLTWIVLTKRFEEAATYFHDLWGANPWPNVWVVFSAGTQRRMDEANAAFARFQASVKGVSAEPLLESVRIPLQVDWVIAGGESGPRARACQMDAVRSIQEQCRQTRTPFFFKQAGAFPIAGRNENPTEWPKGPGSPFGREDFCPGAVIKLHDKKGGDMSEWPEDLRVREWPEVHR